MKQRKPLDLSLPYPPSVNTYWRRGKYGTYLSKKGREYREAVIDRIGHIEPLTADSLKVTLMVYPPDKRRRDLDNTFKAIFDSLEHAGVFLDDAQVKHIDAQMCGKIKDGGIVLRIEEM